MRIRDFAETYGPTIAVFAVIMACATMVPGVMVTVIAVTQIAQIFAFEPVIIPWPFMVVFVVIYLIAIVAIIITVVLFCLDYYFGGP